MKIDMIFIHKIFISRVYVQSIPVAYLSSILGGKWFFSVGVCCTRDNRDKTNQLQFSMYYVRACLYACLNCIRIKYSPRWWGDDRPVVPPPLNTSLACTNGTKILSFVFAKYCCFAIKCATIYFVHTIHIHVNLVYIYYYIFVGLGNQ